MSDTTTATKAADDLFGNEFATAAVPTEAAPEVAPDEQGTDAGTVGGDTEGSKGDVGSFRREIDLGDGSGKQVFEAETADALIDKLTKAQEHATRKIRQQDFELKRAQRARPEKAGPVATKEMSADETFALAQEFQKNPTAALQKALEAIGISPAELIQIKQDRQIQAAERAFLTKHEGVDFLPTPQNAKAIQNFLQKEELPYTAANLEYAFQELSESGLLDMPSSVVPDSTDEKESKEERIVVPEHTRRKPMSSGLRNVNGSVRQEAVAEKKTVEGISESEVAEIYKLSADEARPKMEALMRRAAAGKRS